MREIRLTRRRCATWEPGPGLSLRSYGEEFDGPGSNPSWERGKMGSGGGRPPLANRSGREGGQIGQRTRVPDLYPGRRRRDD